MIYPAKSFLTSDLLREARTRALELKKKKATAAMTTTKKSMEGRDQLRNGVPPKMNLSSESNMSDDLKAFEKDLINESDSEDAPNTSAGTSYVPETTSGSDIIKILTNKTQIPYFKNKNDIRNKEEQSEEAEDQAPECMSMEE